MYNEAYINYLNSMNNASAYTVNALAESQVLNSFYDKIQVERQIVNYILTKIKNREYKTFIITGHAGDGKTSILVQILKQLNLLSKNECLKEADIKSSPYGDIYYVKDMSELSKERQIEYLMNALNAQKEHKTAILISNTGPLLDAFTKVFKGIEEFDETILLKQLDANKDEEININGNSFYLINMARIDNVFFVKQILRKILDDELWKNCNCSIKENCPIYFNVMLLKNNFDKISSIIEAIYRYFYEYDNRMTIRQILSHLTYSITGNLTCAEINEMHNEGKNKHILIKYNFANLFFGYIETNIDNSSKQIKAIKELRKLKIEEKSLGEDYNLFVKGDFSLFTPEIRRILEYYWENKYLKYYSIITQKENEKIDKILQERRLLVKRFYLFYSSNLKTEDIIKKLFGNIFYEYMQLISNSISRLDRKRFKNLIVEGINRINLGMYKTGIVNDRIYITLRRDELTFQKVLILLCEINSEDLEIIQKNSDTNFEDYKNKYKLLLQYNNDILYELSLPLLMYFEQILSGRVETKVSPSLTHGISNLQTKLLEKTKNQSSDKIKILINNFDKIEKITFELYNTTLLVN